MLNQLQLFRNVGQFDAVASSLALSKLTLVYAENGRGKTTIAAVLRSLASGDPLPIIERWRLAAANPPHIVLDCTGGPPSAVFQNGAWNRSFPGIAVFDDHFVDTNVCSGLAIDSDHRQKLHELILGSQGVVLNRALQMQVAKVEEHNRTLRAKADAIPAGARGQFGVDAFCALPNRPDFDPAIEDADRALAAAGQEAAVTAAGDFPRLVLPDFDVPAIEQLLAADLPALDTAAAKRVQQHLSALGRDGEVWIGDGMALLGDEHGAYQCPFCAQSLDASPVIAHYRAYFSDAYSGLKLAVVTAVDELVTRHGGEAASGFERQVRLLVERREFWSPFCEVPQISLDTASITSAWLRASEQVRLDLQRKQAAPLERMAPSDDARTALQAYNQARQLVAALDQDLQRGNKSIALVKERAAGANVSALAADSAALKAAKARHEAAVDPLCAEYLAEQTAKAASEQQRDAARAALDAYRNATFPAYQSAINAYLARFNAGFRLDRVVSTNTRGGSSCTYDVVINNTPVPIGGAAPAPGSPSFRTALSAGDRNALALAFFFASLDQDPGLGRMIVVIDDPISSLDEHRALTTVNEIQRLVQRAGQVVVLSHSKPFLCRLWEGADKSASAAIEVVRDGNGSAIRAWDVHADCITEHDRRDRLLREHLRAATPNAREVAASLRPHLEAFLRVACAQHFPPGTLLGRFKGLCQQRVGTPEIVLSAVDIQELEELTQYANLFHHETNPAYHTVHINDAELTGFVRRTLAFASR